MVTAWRRRGSPVPSCVRHEGLGLDARERTKPPATTSQSREHFTEKQGSLIFGVSSPCVSTEILGTDSVA